MLRFKWYFSILEKRAQRGQTLIMIDQTLLCPHMFKFSHLDLLWLYDAALE